MQVRLLGPLEVVNESGKAVAIGGPKERALWAMLTIHANEVVSEDRLVDALWGSGEPPRTAVRTLQSYLSRLRKVVAQSGDDGSVVLDSAASGWVLRLAPEALDVASVHRLAEVARSSAAQTDHLGAVLAYADALRIWRGPALDEFVEEPWASPEASRLEELRQLLVEERVEAELHCGRHAALIGELDALCQAFPLRERLWQLRMLALYRAGRQADALRVYQLLRRTLAEELGIEPGPTVARLEQSILVHDRALEWTPPGADRSREPEPVHAAAAPTGVVTVLFTDVVGSTELLSRMGDDAYDEVRRDHFGRLRDAVTSTGGAEVKTLGDGLMAVFASAVDAIGCAIAMQRTVARRNRSSGVNRFDIRVGLHAGEPSREEDDYHGAPVVVAKRLCDAAEPGAIVASRLVAELVGSRGGFDFVDRGHVVLKGLSAPVGACSVAWAEEPRPTLPVALQAGAQLSFVGRVDESAVLDGAWDQVDKGALHVALVAGEPGIGKTTLVARAAERAWSRGAAVLFGRCDEDSAVAFQPWIEAIVSYADATQPNDLREQLGPHASDLALLVPSLGRRLPEVAGIVGVGAESERYRIFDAVAGLIRGIGAERPIVLVLDDLHWADRPSLQLLQHVTRKGESPLLVLGTYRDTDLARSHPLAAALAEMRNADVMERIALRGLEADDIVDLVTAGNAVTDTDTRFGWALWHETEGNPLFLRESLRHLAEAGVVDHGADGRWTALRDIDQLGIPEGVKEVIGRRLARLSDQANTVLRVGAVLGREVRLDVLGRVTDLSTDELLDALDDAAAAGIIDELPGGAGRWTFTHALVRQALYEELSLSRRVRLHQQIGEALEGIDGTDDGPTLVSLAHHFAQSAVAGTVDKAVDYARRAGNHALNAAAHAEAARLFASAFDVALDAVTEPSLLIDLLLEQGDAEWRAGDGQIARTTFDRAAALAGPEDPVRLARAACGYAGTGVRFLWVDGVVANDRAISLLEQALENLPAAAIALRARAQAALAQALYYVPGDAERRNDLSSEALATARHIAEPSLLGYVLATRNLAIWAGANVEERRANAKEVVDIGSAVGDRRLEAFGHAHTVLTLLELNDLVGAATALAAFARLADELRDPVAQMLVNSFEAGTALAEGHLDRAEELLNAAFRLGNDVNDPNALLIFITGVGMLRTVQGRLDELAGAMGAYDEIVPVDDPLLSLGTVMLQAESGLLDVARSRLEGLSAEDVAAASHSLMFLFSLHAVSRSCFLCQYDALGETLYELQLPYADHIAMALIGCGGSVHLGLAQSAAVLGRHDVAEEHFAAALDAHRANGWRAWIVETLTVHTIMLERLGRPGDRGRLLEMLDEIVSIGSDIGMSMRVEAAVAAKARLLSIATS